MRPSDLPTPRADDAAPALTRGTALGRFIVLGLVGRGAMGEVYGAYDPDLDRKIAIKLLRPRADQQGDTPERRARLMREAQAAAKISHPNVVVVYDAGTFGDRVFIAMEFVEGHTLRFWLQETERTWHEVLEAFLAAGRGLAAAHAKDFVHRDFKPDNVMVAQGGQVRVMDFGLARIADGAVPAVVEPWRAAVPRIDGEVSDSTVDLVTPPPPRSAGAPVATGFEATSTQAFRDKITATGAVLGTPAYMSPEQFQGLPADARSDQFSFCVALFEALYGARPFAGRTLDELAGNVVGGHVSAPSAGKGVPAAVGKVLQRGLSVGPADRFPTMDALLAELDRAAGAGRRGFAGGAAAKLAGVWEAPVGGHAVETPEKEAMRRAFLATGKPYAAAAFVSASAILDRFAQRWTELYVETCEATHVRGEQSADVLDLRMDCLQEGLADLRALCGLFRAATAEVVENAVKAANALGTLERCRDVKLLRAVVRPPDDAATRAAVDQLRQRLVEVRALFRVGRLAQGLEMAEVLIQEARRVSYAPVLAEILLVAGLLNYETARLDASVAMLEEAFSAAELSRHDEVAAEAATLVSVIVGYYQARVDAGEVWNRYAETLLRRMGGHDLLWGWLYNNRAMTLERQGHLAEAVDHCRRAVEAKARALGPDSWDVGASIGNLANHLAFGCDFAGALAANTQAMEILTATLGPDHPRTALAAANRGQFLYRLGRFEEGIQAANEALSVFERETDPRGLLVTLPLRTLGLCHLELGRPEQALAVLERAAAIRDAIDKVPIRLAEVHFALARALHEARGERERALALARRARREYGQGATTPVVRRDLAEVDRWLAAHGPARGAGAAATRTAAAARPRLRRASRVARRPSSPK